MKAHHVHTVRTSTLEYPLLLTPVLIPEVVIPSWFMRNNIAPKILTFSQRTTPSDAVAAKIPNLTTNYVPIH